MLLRCLKRIVFELLYPLYLIKFRNEKPYIAERLKKAGLRVKPREVYKNLFFNGLDSLQFLRGKKVGLEFENLDFVRSEIGERPVVFVSIHLGAFEMLHRGLAQLNLGAVNLVVSRFRNERLNAFLAKVRAAENINIVWDFEVSKTLRDVVRNNGIIAVMADQSKHGGENFRILGDDVPLFLKLPLAANRMGASLVFFRTFRRGNSHVIRFERVYNPGSQIDKNKIAGMIERWVLEYPEQWAWNYRKCQ